MTVFVYVSIIFGVIGAVMGSFGNMLIYRIPNNIQLQGRSMCPHCKAVLQVRDLFPILSYLLLRGRCRSCKQTIHPQYLLVELLSTGLFLFALFYTSTISSAVLLAFALWLLLVITVIDIHTQGIPDILSFPFILISIIYAAMNHQIDALTFLVCSGFFALQWIVSWGRWIGSGDVLLSIGMSALLGRVDLALVMLCSAYISGSVAALYLLTKKQKIGKDHLAFGPFLAIGTLIALAFGDTIIQTLFFV